ncbi:myocyte-specific enhancer factor 2 isoform X2 [Anthonomus grandis grandis]|uniref:myocyte-specific enhancer factor 2 isoform X2 n=1 Tax=Anthonomus grandis grandis TaxID=2921223 RepID=UPI002166A628|nr:myocyte-specific enhancer factor 2 isoform X2 [Anthonomus grandis grandis]
MGRKKIQISRITDERNRQVTFNKRKFGVMKKAYELSVLCDCEIALIIFSSSNKLYQYASTDMDKVLLKYTEYNEPHESLTNKNIIEALNKKEHKNGVMSPESPEPETEYQLTPRTEAKYSKIDEDFQMMLQRNQSINGQRVSMGSSNYSQPVSVPVNISYGDSGLLQSSPQMAHPSISPRPSSSETDSVYPTGGMLEMSNGYPNSASPIGGSPSPGPSPGPGMNSSKHPKQHSPGPRSNLRVVIPTPLGSSITTDDVSYAEHARSQATLNTPVVALQTPGLGGYPGSLSSFGAQDFSIGSADMTLTSMAWSGHQMVPSLAHSGTSSSGCLPHLAVSSSTPPPTAGSPLPVKIKSEPISPPRDHHTHLSGTAIHHTQAAHVQTLNLTHSSHHPRPSSAGQVTPSPGSVTPTNLQSVSPTPPPPGPSAQDYDTGSVQLHKRPRLSDWPS